MQVDGIGEVLLRDKRDKTVPARPANLVTNPVTLYFVPRFGFSDTIPPTTCQCLGHASRVERVSACVCRVRAAAFQQIKTLEAAEAIMSAWLPAELRAMIGDTSRSAPSAASESAEDDAPAAGGGLPRPGLYGATSEQASRPESAEGSVEGSEDDHVTFVQHRQRRASNVSHAPEFLTATTRSRAPQNALRRRKKGEEEVAGGGESGEAAAGDEAAGRGHCDGGAAGASAAMHGRHAPLGACSAGFGTREGEMDGTGAVVEREGEELFDEESWRELQLDERAEEVTASGRGKSGRSGESLSEASGRGKATCRGRPAGVGAKHRGRGDNGRGKVPEKGAGAGGVALEVGGGGTETQNGPEHGRELETSCGGGGGSETSAATWGAASRRHLGEDDGSETGEAFHESVARAGSLERQDGSMHSVRLQGDSAGRGESGQAGKRASVDLQRGAVLELVQGRGHVSEQKPEGPVNLAGQKRSKNLHGEPSQESLRYGQFNDAVGSDDEDEQADAAVQRVDRGKGVSVNRNVEGGFIHRVLPYWSRQAYLDMTGPCLCSGQYLAATIGWPAMAAMHSVVIGYRAVHCGQTCVEEYAVRRHGRKYK